MAREKATTKSTGGGGFTFADKVAAGFMARMLRRDLFLGVEVGPITALDFETRESDNVLDDLEITLSREQKATRLFVSVKSNRQLTKAGFNSEFVSDAWEQWSGGRSSKPFDQEHDLLGLTVGFIDDQALDEWKTLQEQAIAATPERLVARLRPEGQSNPIQRAIFEDLRNTETDAKRDELETARLVARIRLFPFSEKEENDYLDYCTGIVSDGSLSAAENLWNSLIAIAGESRNTGAHLDLARLLRKLPADLELKDYPDYEADWRKLDALSAENLKNEVQTSLTGGIHLPRTTARAELAVEVEKNQVTVVSGESGSGKSSLVSELAAPGGLFRRTLWLTAGQLSKPSQSEIANALKLRHPIPELIAASALKSNALVVDGFEQFDGDSRRSLVRLIRQIREQDFARWKIVITCQPRTLETVRDTLFEAGVAKFDRVDFEKPALEEILSEVRNVPGLQALLMRKELQPILRNLTVLDWVIREQVVDRIPESQTWIGETQIVDLIWERWITRDVKKFARDGFLRLIGEKEGERLTGAVHIDSLPLDQMELLGELAGRGLLRADSGSVRFFHDLMGDWARYRSLKFAGNNAAARIRELAKVPRWGRAIRLYAQSLAEQSTGLDRWRHLASELAGNDPDAQLAGDLLLEALLFAPNSEALLEQVWGDLIAEKGQILRRLLQRLLHVATVPDWRFQGIGDEKLAARAEAWFRIPHPLYWYPVLRVLARHTQEIVELASDLGAELSALYLRTMPTGMLGRDEASALAVDLAKNTQGYLADGRRLGEKSQTVFEALLYAAPNRPEDIEKIALELSGRLPEPDYALEWAGEQQELREQRLQQWRAKHQKDSDRTNYLPGSTSFRLMRTIPPVPDGPQREVPETFRSAVLDTLALSGLITVRPRVAKEVLLAVSIEEPGEVSRSSGHDMFSREDVGLARWSNGHPAMPWKGSFLRFLEISPEEGLDAIVRLINYATSKRLETEFGPDMTEEQRKSRSLKFEINGTTIFWAGDMNVFGWNRSLTGAAPEVECALMALEQWLDNEIEAGRTIDRWVQYLLDHGNSIGFAGSLISVGLKYPALFVEVLRPLLGNFYLYDWQRDVAAMDRDKAWATSLQFQSPEFIQHAVQWHDQRHRRCCLQDLAPWLMHQDQGTRAYLIERRIAWSQEVHARGEAKTRLEFFLARFDPENYTATPTDDGCIEIRMHLPEHLQAIADRTRIDTELKMLAMCVAPRARRLLDGSEALDVAKLPEYVSDLRKLDGWRYPQNVRSQDHYRVSSIAGGIAVLLVQHRAWVAQDPELETWVLDTLKKLDPTRPEREFTRSASDHTAEAFLGEAAVALLVETDAEWVYRRAFEAITAASYNVSCHTMWRAYLLHAELGKKFVGLTNVVVLWSALRRAGSQVFGPYADNDALAKQKPALYARLIGGRLQEPIPLTVAQRLGEYLVERVERKTLLPGQKEWQLQRKKQKDEDPHEVSREHTNLDIEVLHAGFSFLLGAWKEAGPTPTIFTDIWTELFELEMRTFPAPNPEKGFREFDGTPYDFDTWVMKTAAVYVARTNSIEEARKFYRPILDLGPRARYWTDEFLEQWIVSGLPATTDLEGYVAKWKDMIQYADTLSDWQPGKIGYWCPAEILAPDLMGIDQTPTTVLGHAKYRTVVEAMADTLEDWGNRWLGYASVAQHYSNFLTTDSGEAILAQGVKQLAKAVDSFDEEGWRRYEMGIWLTTVLSVAWSKLRTAIESDPDLRTAFLKLLTVLSARPVQDALILREKVTDALQASS